MRPPLSNETPATIADSRDVMNDQMERFLKHLEGQDYAPSGLAEYRRRLSEFCAQVKAHRVRLEELDENRALKLLAPVELPSKKTRSRFIVRSFVRFMISQGVVKLPPDNSARACIRRDYEQYLRHQRGLSERTLDHCWRLADRFLTFRFGAEVGDLTGLTANDIVSFLQKVHGQTRPLRDKTFSSHLRNFFRYLFQAGKTAANLSLGVPRVAQRYAPRLPRHLTTEEVERVLEAVKAEYRVLLIDVAGGHSAANGGISSSKRGSRRSRVALCQRV